MDSDSANQPEPEERASSGSGEEPPGPVSATAGEDESDPLLGTLLDDRYRIIERLAAGGMGVVYRGERVELERAVAIKFLHVGLLANRDSMKRFKREAMTMSKLTHPNCVSVIDIGVSGAAPYIVMDFVTGKTLEDVVAEEGRLSAGRAIYLVKQILAALAHAHGKDLVHRDIKPANVMLSSAEGMSDHVFVLDFGLAKFNNMRSNNITGASTLLGTPAYMSPEQTKGQNVGPASDVYSTGILLFELLTGVQPYAAETPLETLYMQQGAPVPRLVERAPDVRVSAELEHVVLCAMAKSPDERFESAATFAAALDGVPEAISYTPPRLASPRTRSARAAGKQVRIQQRIAYASTQPVSTLDLELEARERARSSGSMPSPTPLPTPLPRPVSSVATVAMVDPNAEPTASQIGRAPTSPSGPAIAVPPAITAPIAGSPMDSLVSPMASPAASLSGAQQTRAVAATSRPRWLIPAAIGAVFCIVLVIALLAGGDSGDERGASTGDDVADAGSLSDTPIGMQGDVDAGAATVDAAPPPLVVKHVSDVEMLIKQKRVDEALAGIGKLLGSTHKNNPYLWMLQGHMYFEKRYYTKGLAVYRKALKKKKKYRSFATVNKNIIDALAIDKLRKTVNSLYLSVIKRDGLRYLKRAKIEHRSTKVRRRASYLYDILAGRRGR